jgi:hypothetical protein
MTKEEQMFNKMIMHYKKNKELMVLRNFLIQLGISG